MPRCIVIGAGIGGLTAAAVLAREGWDVSVLEAQVYPGGCAGTFYHQGYHFDAGATLAAGFYPGGPMDLVAQATGVKKWPIRLADAAMTVHLPDNKRVTLWSDERRWQERLSAFGSKGTPFWDWQEQTADAMWELALKLPPWPPQSAWEAAQLAQIGYRWLGEARYKTPLQRLFFDALRPVAAHLRYAPENLRLFVDAQLLISAQATSNRVNALYGASALDLSRRGVAYMAGGMGAIAQGLGDAIRQHGGQVHFRQEATRLLYQPDQTMAIKTKRGEVYPADIVIANLILANLTQLMDDNAPPMIPNTSKIPEDGWGAFTAYIGIDGSAIATNEVIHHQVITGKRLAEGNSIFVSISPAWDKSRAPYGQRVITISTHTKLREWWDIYNRDRAEYEDRKAAYAEKILHVSETAIPGIRQGIRSLITATPVTFQKYTRRAGGWVGGFPQTHLSRARGPRIRSGLWMVGDSIFPGQSTAATALGGIRVASQVLNELKYQYRSLSEQIAGFLTRRSIGDS